MMFCFRSILQIWIILIGFNDFVDLGICKHEVKFTCSSYWRFTLTTKITVQLSNCVKSWLAISKDIEILAHTVDHSRSLRNDFTKHTYLPKGKISPSLFFVHSKQKSRRKGNWYFWLDEFGYLVKMWKPTFIGTLPSLLVVAVELFIYLQYVTQMSAMKTTKIW